MHASQTDVDIVLMRGCPTGMMIHGSRRGCLASSHAAPCDIGRMRDARCIASRSSWPSYATESRTRRCLCHIAKITTKLAAVTAKVCV